MIWCFVKSVLCESIFVATDRKVSSRRPNGVLIVAEDQDWPCSKSTLKYLRSSPSRILLKTPDRQSELRPRFKWKPNCVQVRMDDIGSPGEAWDRVAKAYSRRVSHFTGLHAFDLLSSIADQVRSSKTILDVACGPGAFCLAYLKMFPKGIPGQTLIMTDVSSEMVSIAEKEVHSRLPADFQTELLFRPEDATNMTSITDNSVDILVSIFGIFLIPQRDAVFNEVKRVVKPGGTFATTAWTDLPHEMDFKSGFGADFFSSVRETFGKLTKPSDPAPKQPSPSESWNIPDNVRTMLGEASFANIKVHRTIHSTTFQNFEVMWTAVTTSCPFFNLSSKQPNEVADIRKAFSDSVGVENEDEIVYVVMSSNIAIAQV